MKHEPEATAGIHLADDAAPVSSEWRADWTAPHASSARQGATARELERIAALVFENRRIGFEDALFLHEHADLPTLGLLADHVRRAKHPTDVVTYIVDRNLNPTNVCITDCGFCAFYRRPDAEGAYVLSREEIYKRIQETVDLGGQQLLMQGGHHPYLKTAWWVELFHDIRERWPINCHALSAPELDHLAKLDKRPLPDVIRELKEAGLGSVPGAGAEMLVERVRKIIAPKKTSTERWLDVHRQVHCAGLRSSATMMFGHVETAAERVEHLQRLRDLQDETGGFTAFACWTMQPDGVPEEHKYPAKATPAVYLRVQALSRIFLDNIENIQTSYVTQGLKMAQMTLRYGCNDFGGTMLEENVVSAAGCLNLQSIQSIERVIERGGFTPLQRNSWYGIVDPRHPELQRGPWSREEAVVLREIGRPGTVPGTASAPPGRNAQTGTNGGGLKRSQAPGQAPLALIDLAREAGLEDVARKVFAGERISREDGLALYRSPHLHVVGLLANHVRERLHGDFAYFNVNQHVNYTNLCNKLCRFCAFQRLPGQDGAYQMTPEQVAQKIREQLGEPVTEVHMVAGVWPKIPYSYYLEILRAVKAVRPSIHVKAFTMVELDQIAKVAKKPLEEVLPELIAAGLGSVPGGGAEVFAERVRQETYHLKLSGEQWLDTARKVHRAGLKSNCTMLHGHIETFEERVDHLDRLRTLQDETHGFQTYIPLSFHPENSEMADVPGPTALDELRELAVGRLMLDNIPHVKAYWILMDVPVAQVALSYGADDVDGTVVEERIYHEAGATTPQVVKRAELVQWIRDAGRIPVERDTLYNVVWSEDPLLAPIGQPAPVRS